MSKLKRNIIKIDEEKCNGCGACLPGCPEGALKIVDTPDGLKAKLVRENFCDGLGACLGNCPQGALTVEEKLAEEYDEAGVIKHIKKTAPDKLNQHIDHLKHHGIEVDTELFKNKHEHSMPCGCPGSAAASWGENKPENKNETRTACCSKSQLRHWPVQLTLVSPEADYFNNADLLVAADCVPFAFAGFHEEFLKNKTLVIGCPKLDDAEFYEEKLTEIFKKNNIKSVTVAHMEVPCCSGLDIIVKNAIKKSGKRIPYCKTIVGIKGDMGLKGDN